MGRASVELPPIPVRLRCRVEPGSTRLSSQETPKACAARGITLSTLQERLPPPGKLNDRLSLTDEEADEESDLEGFDQIGYQATVDLFVV